MKTQITINTKQVPVSVLKEYCETCNYGEFTQKVRRHFDPLYKLPYVKNGKALFIADADELGWLMTYAYNQAEAVGIFDDYPHSRHTASGISPAWRVDKELIDITPPRDKPKPCYRYPAK